MIGIGRYGSYVPYFRLDRSLIAQAWGARQPKGEIAVANYDEDALTLGIEAAMSCLGDPPHPGGGAGCWRGSAPCKRVGRRRFSSPRRTCAWPSRKRNWKACWETGLWP